MTPYADAAHAGLETPHAPSKPYQKRSNLVRLFWLAVLIQACRQFMLHRAATEDAAVHAEAEVLVADPPGLHAKDHKSVALLEEDDEDLDELLEQESSAVGSAGGWCQASSSAGDDADVSPRCVEERLFKGWRADGPQAASDTGEDAAPNDDAGVAPSAAAFSSGHQDEDIEALQEHLSALQEGLAAQAMASPGMGFNARPQEDLLAQSAAASELIKGAIELRREMCSEPHSRAHPLCDVSEPPPAVAGLSMEVDSTAALWQEPAAVRTAARREETWAMPMASKASSKAAQPPQGTIAQTGPRGGFNGRFGGAAPRSLEWVQDQNQWTRLLVNNVQAFGRKLCSDAKRRRYPSCRLFVASKAASAPAVPAPTPTVALRGTPLPVARSSDPLLVWRREAFMKETTNDVVRLAKDQLEAQRWKGKIPKVACVTVLTSARDVRERLRYFVNAFLAQDYEGPRQLILVYRVGDRGIANVVQEYADGIFIKEAPIYRQSSRERFPSAAAYRYGAWQADDADVIARWEFDSWHDPKRLLLQVRALALSSRPAVILSRAPPEEGEPSEELPTIGHGTFAESMVGEVEWMGNHWFPLPPGEDDPLPDVEANRTALLAVPDLAVSRASFRKSHPAPR